MKLLTVLMEFLRDDLLIVASVGFGCILVASCLEHRSAFRLRVALCFAAAALWMMVTKSYDTMTNFTLRFAILRYMTLFVLFGLSVPFCSRASFCQSVYAITVAYSIQNMCERLIEIPRGSLESFPLLLDRFCLFLLLAFSLGVYYRLLVGDARQRSMFDFTNLNSRMMLFLGAGVVAITVVMDLIMRGEARNASMTMKNCLNIMSAVFSFLAVVVCMSHLRETESERRAQVSAQLLYSEQRRYEQEKQIHDAINIKCHDIRHQIAALGEAGYRNELKQIGKLVNIYDTAPHTQNAALDVVLGGKMLACVNQGITLTCLADGRRMGFMEDSDIYALFGNILDNAIDATANVQDPERHLISLTVGTVGDLLMIESQNFFSGTLTFRDGLPETSKQDRDYHGFGTQSIRSLTEKYGGDLKMQAEQGVFRLSILIPIPD